MIIIELIYQIQKLILDISCDLDSQDVTNGRKESTNLKLRTTQSKKTPPLLPFLRVPI